MAQYKPTVNVTNGSADVVIVGEDATSTLVAGNQFYVKLIDGEYIIGSVGAFAGGNTTITLTGNYTGNTASGAEGVFQIDETVDGIPLMARQDFEASQVVNRLARVIQSIISGLKAGTTAFTDLLVSGTATAGAYDLSAIDTTAYYGVTTPLGGFIYRTADDSDNGAWRYKQRSTSWEGECPYGGEFLGPVATVAARALLSPNPDDVIWNVENDRYEKYIGDNTLYSGEQNGRTSDSWQPTTRGPTRKFPAIVDIIWEADTVWIFDRSGAVPVMWMKFEGAAGSNTKFISYGTNGGQVSSAPMKNGKLAIGRTSADTANQSFNGAIVVDFPAGEAIRYGEFTSNTGVFYDISARNSATLVTKTLPLLVENHVNSVALTILPSSPIDPASGMPYVTAVLGTDGGASVINGLAGVGTVVDITGATVDEVSVKGDRLAIDTGGTTLNVGSLSSVVADVAVGTWRDYFLNASSTPALITSDVDGITITDSGPVAVGASGATLLKENPTTPSEGMVAHITSTYATPLMQGDVELCLAGDSLTDRSVTGTTVTDNGTATFAAVDTGCDLEATTATSGTITAPVTTGGECYGWEKVGGVWTYREAIADWVGVSEAAGTLTIADGTIFTRLVYVNGSGPSTSQLEESQRMDEPLFIAGTKMLLGADAATCAPSYDPYTELWRHGNSNGVDTFDGLVRIDQDTTTTSPKGLSAVNDYTLEVN